MEILCTSRAESPFSILLTLTAISRNSSSGRKKGRGADFVEIEPAVHQNNGKDVTGNRPEFSFKTAP